MEGACGPCVQLSAFCVLFRPGLSSWLASPHYSRGGGGGSTNTVSPLLIWLQFKGHILPSIPERF